MPSRNNPNKPVRALRRARSAASSSKRTTIIPSNTLPREAGVKKPKVNISHMGMIRGGGVSKKKARKLLRNGEYRVRREEEVAELDRLMQSGEVDMRDITEGEMSRTQQKKLERQRVAMEVDAAKEKEEKERMEVEGATRAMGDVAMVE